MHECAICLELINKNIEYKTTCCQQHFCICCINHWLSIKNNCPLCRSKISKFDEPTNIIEKINTSLQWFIYFFQLVIIFLGFLAEYNKK